MISYEVESSLGWSMRTLQSGSVILGYIRACKSYCVLPVAAGEYGFVASFKSNL